MAQMYPRVFPADNPSSGEKKVFEFFKANAPADWHILHSFRLPKHRQVVFGEADFIVIAPKYGVFILEVKSGGVGFNGTDWIFINRKGEQSKKQRGPFQQAREAMFEVEKIITDKLGLPYTRSKILYGYGVIFTDESKFPASDMTEDEPWRLYQNNGNNDYCEFIKNLSRRFAKELQGIGKLVPGDLSNDKAENFAKTLRPIVECVVPLKSFIRASESEIIALTEEQFDCLDDIELNKQIVVFGGAGTGKTLLAAEDARRSAKQLGRIGFFCFNKNLAAFLKSNIAESNITVSTLHAFMEKPHLSEMDIMDYTVIASDARENPDYFSVILPQTTAQNYKKFGVKFDKIIVDEFQDLCTEDYLAVFDSILAGGLIDGRFSFYGDFARQAIFNESASLDVLNKIAFFARKRLSVNCRNTKNIGNELINVTGYNDNSYRLKVLGEPVDYLSWNSIEEQVAHLKTVVSNLKKKGFGSESITILSPYRRENSVVDVYDADGFIVGNYGEDLSAYHAMFATIHSFKGLESEIIILIDIDNYRDSKLLYVALSRARSKLIVLESANAAKQRKKQMIARA